MLTECVTAAVQLACRFFQLEKFALCNLQINKLRIYNGVHYFRDCSAYLLL